MAKRCPVCHQALPESIDPADLQSRLGRLAAPMLRKGAQKLREELEEVYSAQLENAVSRAVAQRDAELERLKRKQDAEIERVRKQVARAAALEAHSEVEALQLKLDRERTQRERDMLQYQKQVDLLQRKLEKQTGQQLGDAAEIDLLAALRNAFPTDQIEPVRKGVKGADIVHRVRSGGNEIGTIIWESKNVSAWQNAFVTKAKQHKVQYDTPYVVIVTTTLPRKSRGFCVQSGIPVISPQMAVALGEIMRDAIVEVGSLRQSSRGRDAKAQKLFDFIVGDEFRTRFNQIEDAVDSLKERQQKEKSWHENHWEAQSKLMEQVEARRREIAAKIQAVIRDESPKAKLRMVTVSA